MLTLSPATGSTAYHKIDAVLKYYPWYHAFMNGYLPRLHYLHTLLDHEQELLGAGLNQDQIHLSTRFAINAEQAVDSLLQQLRTTQIIPCVDYPKNEFELFWEKVHREFDHTHRLTYIFPEEARLLYALTHILQPLSLLFLGSFYGYLAIWAMPALAAVNGRAYLFDVDEHVLHLAEKNMRHFGFAAYAHSIHENAITYMMRQPIAHDMAVLDAEGPKTGPHPDLLDKAIYYPIIKTSTPALVKNGVVLCHNILTSHALPDPYYASKVAYHRQQFKKFLPYMQQHYSLQAELLTTEGIGIYKK